MTHEVEQPDGVVHDVWAELGPADEIPSQPLPDVPIDSEEAVATDYDPTVVLGTASMTGP